jgi:hypothetical protein
MEISNNGTSQTTRERSAINRKRRISAENGKLEILGGATTAEAQIE